MIRLREIVKVGETKTRQYKRLFPQNYREIEDK